jgi:hypothetical protein
MVAGFSVVRPVLGIRAQPPNSVSSARANGKRRRIVIIARNYRG